MAILDRYPYAPLFLDPRGGRPFRTTPFDHQLHGLETYGGREAYALNCEMGTGKTWIVINEAANLWGEKRLGAVMVFAPKGVHTNWIRNELPAHMPVWVRFSPYGWNAKNTKAEANAREKAREKALGECWDDVLLVFAMNWEALGTARGSEAAEAFCRANADRGLMIVADESQKVKDFAGVRSKKLHKLKPFSRFRRNMSGSPILNSPFDAFAQYMFLDEAILRTTSFSAFKANYAVMKHPKSPDVRNIMRKNGMKFAPQIVETDDQGLPRYRRLDQLQKLIAPHTYRVLKKDCLDLPEKVYTKTYFEMTPKQEKAYKLLKEKARVVCESGEETALARLSAMMKLQQALSNYVLSPETNLPFEIDPDENPKLDLLQDRLETLLADGVQVIVWARFIHEIEAIMRACEKSGWPAVSYYGATPGEDRMEAIRSFQSGEKRVFVSQQQAGSTGITLTAASHTIYYSNTFGLGDRLQSEDRAHRIGQTKTCTYEDIACAGTIDERIALALAAKKNVADIINGDKAAALLDDDEALGAILDPLYIAQQMREADLEHDASDA
jgi:hypothetical protein